MAYNGNKFLFTHIKPDSSVLPEETPETLTAEEQMQVLEDRLQEYSEGWNPDYKLTYEKTKENGKTGYNIHLPYGVDFRIEHGHITFSKFGLSKDELKNVYNYLYQLGVSGLSFDEQAKDLSFEQTAKAAEQELKNEDGLYETGFVQGASQTPHIPQAANSNIATDTTGLSEEEALKARRQMAKQLRKNVYTSNPEQAAAVEEHPSVNDIDKYITAHVRATHKDQSNNYKKVHLGNGYKLMWYKDSDQKREGPKADKSGKVTPNFDAGLKAIIENVDGKPHLRISVLTPKYGDAPDWVFDEAVGLAATAKTTHLRFEAAAAFKGKFLNSCAKRMIVPTGVKLKEKEFAAMMKLVKENNDDPIKRAEFYAAFAEQLENDLINDWQKDKNPNHPYIKMIKNLKIQIAVENSEEKYKRFNNFFEKNIQGKIYLDTSDIPLDLYEVKDPKQGPNAVKEMATGLAYVELLAEYIKNPEMKGMSDEQLRKIYLESYNKNLYVTHKNLRKKLESVSSSKDVKEVLNREYQKVQKNISSIRSKVAFEGFDKLSVPQMDKYTYYDVAGSEKAMMNRLKSGQNIFRRDTGQNMILPQMQGAARA